MFAVTLLSWFSLEQSTVDATKNCPKYMKGCYQREKLSLDFYNANLTRLGIWQRPGTLQYLCLAS